MVVCRGFRYRGMVWGRGRSGEVGFLRLSAGVGVASFPLRRGVGLRARGSWGARERVLRRCREVEVVARLRVKSRKINAGFRHVPSMEVRETVFVL